MQFRNGTSSWGVHLRPIGDATSTNVALFSLYSETQTFSHKAHVVTECSDIHVADLMDTEGSVVPGIIHIFMYGSWYN